jgi:glycosyltransferase involved in cell wall biosynthesis
MQSENKIGCLVVSHNRPNLLEKTLESLRATTKELRDFEIIVYDNASDAPTQEYLLKAVQNGFINRVIFDRVNRYPGYAYNRAMELFTEPKYLVFSDNDIVYKEGWLDHAIKIFEDMPEMGMIGLLNNMQGIPPEHREESIVRYRRKESEVNIAFPNIAGAILLRAEVYYAGGRWPEGDWSQVTWPAYHFCQEVKAKGFQFCNVIEDIAYESAFEDYAENEAYYREKFKQRGVESLLDERMQLLANGKIKNGYVGGN